MTEHTLQRAAWQCLMIDDPVEKCLATQTLAQSVADGYWRERLGAERAVPAPVPGRPPKPELVAPSEVRKRGPGSVAGRAALYHALAHIEFNAINLSLDAVYRFTGLPYAFASDWMRVADDEARHFSMLTEHLASLGFAYGDFPAHNNLWEMALRTDFDPMVRMALVPRVLEARGLDVAPGMIEKLDATGDSRGADILRIILREEVEHVRIGNRWFLYHCEQRALDPRETFRALLREHTRGFLTGPFNDAYRKQAGFTDAELADLREIELEFIEQVKSGLR
ncbi:MAG: ferritin-like domain-containing protein [Pseudomonadota bacterium]